jgi:hypothetical protein
MSDETRTVTVEPLAAALHERCQPFPAESEGDYVRRTIREMHRRLVLPPEHGADSIDAAIGYALNDCEERVMAALYASNSTDPADRAAQADGGEPPRWGDGDEGEAAVKADFDAEALEASFHQPVCHFDHSTCFYDKEPWPCSFMRSNLRAAQADTAPGGGEDVIRSMETFAAARERDVRDNRDAPDNINAAVAAVVRGWIDRLRDPLVTRLTTALVITLLAQGLDLLTFAAAIGWLGVPIALESNPLYVRSYVAGGLLAVLVLKLALAAVMLYLVGRLNPSRATLGVALVTAFGLVGACSNVWTSLIWLNLRGY